MTTTGSEPRRRLALTLALLATGGASIVGQLVLLRELSVAFFGVELAYLLGLGIWLLGSGAGAALAARRRRVSLPSLAAPFVLFAFLLLSDLAFLRGARRLMGAMSGAYLSPAGGLTTVLVGLVPLALISGVLFARAVRWAVAGGRTFAWAYAAESAGGLVGGLGATWALAAGANAVALALVAALVVLAAAGAALLSERRVWRLAVGACGLVVAVALLRASALDERLTRWNHEALVESRDSPYARYTVTRRAGQVVFFVNDALAFESEGVDAETFVDPVLLAHARPERVAVLGLGSGDLVREVLRHDPTAVDVVELDAVALELARRYLPSERTAALDDARVHLVIGDPRRFLERAASYDAILIGIADPDSGQTNRFYTREFFAACARHLTERGVLGLRLRSAENFWTPRLAAHLASIDHALRTAFSDVLFLPGTTDVVLASPAALPRDADTLVHRFQARALSARLISPVYLRYLMTNDRVVEMAARLAATAAPANSDARPVCYAQAAGLWLTRLFPPLGFVDARAAAGRGAFSGIAFGVLLLVALGAWLTRCRPALRRLGIACVAGLSGMVVEGVVILHFQAQRGALFQDLGVLLTAFMAGLALGAHGLDRVRSSASGRSAGIVILVAMAVVDLLVAEVVRSGASTGLVGNGVLLLAEGATVGAALAWASLRSDDPGRAGGSLYAADLIGGALGALLASLFLVPAFGLVASASLVAVWALAATLWA
jgi:spermidine synthase